MLKIDIKMASAPSAELLLAPDALVIEDFGDEFTKIKKELNAAKSVFDNMDPKKISAASRSRPVEALLRPDGRLAMHYGAEVVTNAWAKMYEMMTLVPVPKTTWRTFHVAEAPGNFMLAINHYIGNHHTVAWDWKASSYIEPRIYDVNNDKRGGRERRTGQRSKLQEDGDPGGYLGDQYGIIRKNPARWMWGADGDGDITSSANIREWAIKCRCDFYTSDVKYVPKDNANVYTEEERINIPVCIGHLVGALATLDHGGAMVLKQFTFLEPANIAAILFAAGSFQEFSILKPVTSRPQNSEIYLFGRGYEGISREQLEKWYDYLDAIRHMNDSRPVPAIMRKSIMPDKFLADVADAARTLADRQIEAIEQIVDFVNGKIEAVPGMGATEWEKEFNIKKIGNPMMDK